MSTMSQKTVLITGGNSGIGKECAVELARQGARLVITARDQGKGQRALEEIIDRSGSRNIALMPLDLASFRSIEDLAKTFLKNESRLDVLINNAGLMLSKRSVTDEGYEATFGVNHLGHFLLTKRLLGKLTSCAPSRIVVVSSGAHKGAYGGLDFDDLQHEKKYAGFEVYCRSKLANIYFARALARRTEGTGVTVNAMHPGFVASRFAAEGDTAGLFSMAISAAKVFAISPAKGARTIIYLASAQEVEGISGEYFYKGKVARISRVARDDDAAERLWAESERLVAAASPASAEGPA